MLGAWYDVIVPPQATEAISARIEAEKQLKAIEMAKAARQAGEARAEAEIERRTAEVKAAATKAAGEQAYAGAKAGLFTVGLIGIGLWLLLRK